VGIFVQDVAGRSGCTTDAIVAAIHERQAIEILLRPRHSTPADPHDGDGTGTPAARVQVNARFLRDIVTDAVGARNRRQPPPCSGAACGQVAPHNAHATPLSIAMLRVFLDRAADFSRAPAEDARRHPDLPHVSARISRCRHRVSPD
jgi:hypothetical protein